MTDEERVKLKSKISKLAGFMVKHKITKSDIVDLAAEDPNFDNSVEIIGRTLNYFEWRVHPVHPQIECSTEGEIRIGDVIKEPIFHNGRKIIKITKNKKIFDFDVAQNVLRTYVPMPESGNWTVGFRDNNPKNCRINNLYWRKIAD